MFYKEFLTKSKTKEFILRLNSRLHLRWKILSVFFLQILFLAYMITQKQLILVHGKEIRLEVLPIDPRSLFRGDYVILQYSINQVPKELLLSKEPIESPIVYTLLEKQENRKENWKVVSVHSSIPKIPKTKKDQVFLEGQLDSKVFKKLQSNLFDDSKSISIRYGIEDYFVPEGEGKELEQLRDQKKLTVALRVDSKGKAVIQTLFVNDQPVYQESLFR